MSGTRLGRKLGRKTGHRVALCRNLACSLIKYESIKTTEAKAKTLKRFVDILIAKAKKDDLSARRMIRKDINQKEVFVKIFKELVPRFKDREGGVVKLVKLNNRLSDNAPMCCVKLIS